MAAVIHQSVTQQEKPGILDPGCNNINFLSILDRFSIVLGSILHLFSVDYEVWKEFMEFVGLENSDG